MIEKKIINLFYITGFTILIMGCSKDSKSETITEEPILINYFIDNDKDGYGNPDKTFSLLAESKPNGYIDNNLDCDDTNKNINPLVDDYAYDGLDFNCDGKAESIITAFSKTYGGSDFESARSVVQAKNGNYLIVGYTASADGDVSINKGDRDVWIIKLDNNGNLLWEKTYGGSDIDEAHFIIQNKLGDFLILGTTGSRDFNVSNNNGLLDYWILKIDIDGNILWQETFGGSMSEYPQGIVESTDGHFALIGFSESPDGDVAGNKGDSDIWFARINANGTLVTSVTYGGSGYDRSDGIIEDQDGNYIISGTTYSKDGDLTGINDGIGMNWILKIDKEGAILTNTVYGGNRDDQGTEIINTSDGGYLLGGHSFSDNNGLTNNGSGDVWVMKFSIDNQISWQMNFGGSRNDYVRKLLELEDGYMVLCDVFSGDGQIERNYGTGDLEPILLKLDKNGNIKWQKNYGGSSSDSGADIINGLDGGYLMVGSTGSNNYDILLNKGKTDAWLLKLDPEFNLNPNR
jgi:hypothetical protein